MMKEKIFEVDILAHLLDDAIELRFLVFLFHLAGHVICSLLDTRCKIVSTLLHVVLVEEAFDDDVARLIERLQDLGRVVEDALLVHLDAVAVGAQTAALEGLVGDEGVLQHVVYQLLKIVLDFRVSYLEGANGL